MAMAMTMHEQHTASNNHELILNQNEKNAVEITVRVCRDVGVCWLSNKTFFSNLKLLFVPQMNYKKKQFKLYSSCEVN